MTILPKVPVIWHGVNGYSTHDVATASTVRRFVLSLSTGTEFSVGEATEHIRQCVKQEVDAMPQEIQPQYETDLFFEAMDQSDIEAIGFELDYLRWEGLLERVPGDYPTNADTRYCRI